MPGESDIYQSHLEMPGESRYFQRHPETPGETSKTPGESGYFQRHPEIPEEAQGTKYTLGEKKLPRAVWVSPSSNPFFLMNVDSASTNQHPRWKVRSWREQKTSQPSEKEKASKQDEKKTYACSILQVIQ